MCVGTDVRACSLYLDSVVGMMALSAASPAGRATDLPDQKKVKLPAEAGEANRRARGAPAVTHWAARSVTHTGNEEKGRGNSMGSKQAACSRAKFLSFRSFNTASKACGKSHIKNRRHGAETCTRSALFEGNRIRRVTDSIGGVSACARNPSCDWLRVRQIGLNWAQLGGLLHMVLNPLTSTS